MSEQRLIDIELELEDLSDRLNIIENALKVFLTEKMDNYLHTCDNCGDEFFARSNAKFCSPNCRQQAYLHRKKWRDPIKNKK